MLSRRQATSPVHSGNGNRNGIIKEKGIPAMAGKKGVYVNDTKVGALLFFPLVAIVLTSCLRDMRERNSTMHREPNLARGILVDCPVKDPDNVWLLMCFCYLVVVGSVGVLCCTMLGLNFRLFGTARSTKMRIAICRICLLLFYWGFYNWDICMGTMPYLKKATTQIYFATLIFIICTPMLTMPLAIPKSAPKPPRWPLFIIKTMVFLLYADAGWHKINFGWTSETLKAFLVHHWIYYERSLATFMIDYPFISFGGKYATLLFECFGWILLLFDYDLTAAMIGLSFHIGIYFSMYIDFITFWCCSYVFFFVPTIIASDRFQRLLKRQHGKKSVSVPLGCSLFVESETGKKDFNGEVDSRSKRVWKPSILVAVSCVVALTYKGLYPYTLMLPPLPQYKNPSFLNILYGQLCGLTFKPFNTYDMYNTAGFPMRNTVAFLNLKQANDEQVKRIKYIPHRGSDLFLYSNILPKVNANTPHQTFTFDSIKKGGVKSSQTVNKCNVYACLARSVIFSESVGDWTEDDVDSIEIVQETFVKNTDTSSHGEEFYGSLLRSSDTFCALDIGVESQKKAMEHSKNDRKRRDSSEEGGDFQWYEDGTCDDILSKLDLRARSVDTTTDINPWNIIPVPSRTRKHLKKGPMYRDAPFWTVFIIMICVGYKTYLLEK